MSGIVLDTNVVCEALRPEPDAGVEAWFALQSAERLHLTATVIGEIAFGIGMLPRGRRRGRLEAWLGRLVTLDFAGRILPYDTDAPLVYGEIMAAARGAGYTPGPGDVQIAADARRHGFAVATRDVGDFAPLGVEVLDPWASPPS